MKLYIRETMLTYQKVRIASSFLLYLKYQRCKLISSTVHRVIVFHVTVNSKSQAWRWSHCFARLFVPSCLEECCSVPNWLWQRKADVACVICLDSVFSFYKMQSWRNVEKYLPLKPLLHAEKTYISHCYCLIPSHLRHQFRKRNSSCTGICEGSIART